MTIKNRLAKAEKAKRAATPEEIQVWLYDDETGLHTRTRPDGTRETLTEAEFQESAKGHEVITVKAADNEY